ncbi:acyltransferase domain-containing protein, partial [Kitasatospora sp. NPDC001159]
RRAAVSSFGISGTNAHVILEQGPEPVVQQDAAGTPAALPFLLSAKTPKALQAQATRLLTVLDDANSTALARSLATTRALHDHRAVVTAADPTALREALNALAEGRTTANAVTGAAQPTGHTVLVFPGQGSQWLGMAVELLDTAPVFRARIEECAAALEPFTDWSLLDVLRGTGDEASLERVDVVQPALWAVMVSLAELWRSYGVRPDAVVGHSQGEIAAAAVTGALSLGDAAKVVALRSRALRGIAGLGGMVSVPLPVEQVRERIAGRPDRLSIAAVNGPAVTVVSGDADALRELVAGYEREEVRARVIPVDYASHSAHVDAIREEVLGLLAGIEPRSTGVAFYSTVTGGPVDTAGLDPEYWMRNLRRTVLFEQTVNALLADGYGVFVESSAHPVLTVGVQQVVEAAGREDRTVVAGSLRRGEGGLLRFLASAAEVHVRGGAVDWSAVLPAAPRVDLPTYPFEHGSYWLVPGAGASGVGSAGLSGAEHPLLGAAVERADEAGPLFTGRVSLRSHPWLAEHAVLGTVLVPGAALVDLAIHAGDRVGCGRIEELTIEAPLVVPQEGAVRLQVLVDAADADGRRPFAVYSRPDDAPADRPWTRHAAGALLPTDTAPEAKAGPGGSWPPERAVEVPVAEAYPLLAATGLEYGPGFRGLRATWRRGGELFVEAALPESAAPGAFGLHPVLLDSVLHGLALSGSGDAPRLPFSWSQVSLFATGARTVRARIAPTGPDTVSLELVDTAGAPVASVEALTVRPVAADQLAPVTTDGDDLFAVDWSTLPEPVEPLAAPEGWVLLGADTAGLTGALPLASAADLDGLAAAGVRTAFLCASGAPDVRSGAVRVLDTVRAWLADERFAEARLVVVTRRAVAVHAGEDVPDLPGAAVWGLVRSAQTEHPDRFVLLDLDGRAGSAEAVPAALASGEPQLAVRDAAVLVPRLARAAAGQGLTAPLDGPWQLDVTAKGSLDKLALVACPEVEGPLAEGQVRLAVRAAGLNFRDILITLGMVPDDGRPAASEGAGVVLEVGPGVTGFAPGDEVMGLIGKIGPVSVADHRLLAPKPRGWGFAEAAGAPVVYLTAYYGLRDLAKAEAGESLLLHAATGGVGMAALQLAH